MPRRHTERRTYAQRPHEVRATVERVVRELGLRPRPGDGEWEIVASRPIGPMTWGERITVITATDPGGGTQVIAESRLTFGLVDWGHNRANVESILGGLDTTLGTGDEST